MKKLRTILSRLFRTAFVGLWLVISTIVFCQDTLTLDYCFQQAEKNYPLNKQLAMLKNSKELKINNLNKNYLPQFNVNASASIQSDVTQVAIELPVGLPELSMPVIPKDWYKLAVDLNQVIYDGNITHYQKKVEEFSLQADQKGVEIELYKVKDRINQIFFTIILLQKNEEILKSNQHRIETKLNEVQSGIQNGAILEMNADLLKAEIVRLDQQLMENSLDRNTSIKMLAELISVSVPENSILIVPEVSIPNSDFVNKRPENALFDIQRSKIMLMKEMVTTKWNPKIFAYGQAGYGRPSLNMLDPAFKPWVLVGAKFTWIPLNWNQNKNEKKILEIQSDILGTQQETFDKNLKISAQKDLSEILKLNELLVNDEEIILLRIKITKAASSQLDNGVITSSDYITRLNEETQARLSREIHKIQLVKSKLSYLYTLGKL